MTPIFLKPVFKEMIWGGNRLGTDLAMRFREMTPENAGRSVRIRTETARSQAESMQGCI